MLNEILENRLIISGKIGYVSGKIEAIQKDQWKFLKYSIYISSFGGDGIKI